MPDPERFGVLCVAANIERPTGAEGGRGRVVSGVHDVGRRSAADVVGYFGSARSAGSFGPRLLGSMRWVGRCWHERVGVCDV
jgi:hypothetical protein